MIESRIFRRLAFGLLCLAPFGTTAAIDSVAQRVDDGWRVAPQPVWVSPVVPFSSSHRVRDAGSDGIDVQLSERQHDARADRQYQYFRAVEYAYTSSHGVAEYSQIGIEFDPTYQQLLLHDVTVQRGGRRIDKLMTLRADLLRQERDLDALIYDGTHSLNLLLDDVRVGDVLRYAYTIVGENPIFGQRREFAVSTSKRMRRGHAVRTRILSSPSRPLHRRARGHDLSVKEIRHADMIETIVEAGHALASEDTSTRIDTDENGTLVFSDIADWSAAVDWARPLYALGDDSPAELSRVAASIAADHDDNAARIGAALQWVQNEIRYFGIELGADSHQPASPDLTLERRFGDCKGKAILLMTLLGELDIASQAALVDTSRNIRKADYPWRLHAFDHVIVHVEVEGTSHFIDPTRGWQRGALGELHEPDYGRALIIAPGVSALQIMGTDFARRQITIDKHLVVPPESASATTFSVTTRREGRAAENLRSRAERDGLEELGDSYSNYYRNDFEGLKATRDPVLTELAGNTNDVVEDYLMPTFWEESDGATASRWLRGDEILGWVTPAPDDDPDDKTDLVHPIDVLERWRVSLPTAMASDYLESELKTRWFDFEKSYTLDATNNELAVTMRYRSRVGELDSVDTSDYAEALDALDDHAGFRIENRRPPPPWLAGLSDWFEQQTSEESPVLTTRERIEVLGMGMAVVVSGGVALRRRRGNQLPSTEAPDAADPGGLHDKLAHVRNRQRII